ncbi:hypothetical protein ACJX0J_042171, partial [Zea mays]
MFFGLRKFYTRKRRHGKYVVLHAYC